jgi:flavin reductase (DIM6/NTAB) family NADH-FMN oxidoreductase RutF
MPVDPQQFRKTMRRWATGVSIVSTRHANVQHGMTVSSFMSVSLTPPAILVSLERTTRTHDLLIQSGIFGVTILSSVQQEISDRFAGRHSENQDRFAGLVTKDLVTGAPFIEGGIGFLDCRVLSNQVIGTHTVFIGEVLAAQYTIRKKPLLYYNRQYHGLQF